MNKLRKKSIILFPIIMLTFACSTNNNEISTNSISNNNNDNFSTSILDIPSSQGTSQIPEVDDQDLVGNAETDGADAVIELKRTTATFNGKSVNIINDATYGIIIEITASGRYIIQGTLEQGFIAISKKELNVTLILNGVNIFCKNYSPIVSLKKSDVEIILAEGSTNYLTDGAQGASDGKYNLGYDSDEQPNATLLIRKDLTINGSGKLIINGNLNNGIGSRANLKINSGDIQINAKNNAIKGNDSIKITGGVFSLVSEEDGIKTEEITEGLGIITITGGNFAISSKQDAIQASTDLFITDAGMNIKTADGSSAKAISESAKGLKADNSLMINSGYFIIDSNDDAIHSNVAVTINGGIFTISSGDDGIHADKQLTINDGIIEIVKSYEGLEAQNINLNGGNVRLVATDDGINIAGGADDSGTPNRPGPGPGGGGGSPVIDGTLTITGGRYYINSTGDGLDSNGNIVMTGGLVVVHGPTSSMDAPIDYDGSFKISGGTIIALGSSQMAQQPGSSSTQYSVLAKFSSAITAGKIINMKSTTGSEIITIECVKSVQSIVVSTPNLIKGSYTISTGGSYSNNKDDFGLYYDGVYSGGTTVKTFTISNITTTVN